MSFGPLNPIRTCQRQLEWLRMCVYVLCQALPRGFECIFVNALGCTLTSQEVVTVWQSWWGLGFKEKRFEHVFDHLKFPKGGVGTQELLGSAPKNRLKIFSDLSDNVYYVSGRKNCFFSAFFQNICPLNALYGLEKSSRIFSTSFYIYTSLVQEGLLISTALRRREIIENWV